jgi:anti-anti-sigma regulatory factor
MKNEFIRVGQIEIKFLLESVSPRVRRTVRRQE